MCFASELSMGNRSVWEFGWAYGIGKEYMYFNESLLITKIIIFLGWGAAIFLFGAVVLLLCDKESEEIYYKERKIVHEATAVRD